MIYLAISAVIAVTVAAHILQRAALNRVAKFKATLTRTKPAEATDTVAEKMSAQQSVIFAESQVRATDPLAERIKATIEENTVGSAMQSSMRDVWLARYSQSAHPTEVVLWEDVAHIFVAYKRDRLSEPDLPDLFGVDPQARPLKPQKLFEPPLKKGR
ncbi:hypothetical protein [Hyphomicrobium sp.]|uniref:hypothetical protein n=1 Tax=Hyphomicrobium sp. TaxID=82 RepID=UPI003F6F90B5